MSKNNYMGKIDKDYSGTTIPNYDSFKPHFEMLSGSETNQYIHYRYSEAPFGYRPADIDDIPNKENIIKNIKKIILGYKEEELRGDYSDAHFAENETNRKLIDWIIEDINKII